MPESVDSSSVNFIIGVLMSLLTMTDWEENVGGNDSPSAADAC